MWNLVFHWDAQNDFLSIGPGPAQILLGRLKRLLAASEFQKKGIPWAAAEGYVYFTVAPHLVVCVLDETQQSVLVLSILDEDGHFRAIENKNPARGLGS